MAEWKSEPDYDINISLQQRTAKAHCHFSKMQITESINQSDLLPLSFHCSVITGSGIFCLWVFLMCAGDAEGGCGVWTSCHGQWGRLVSALHIRQYRKAERISPHTGWISAVCCTHTQGKHQAQTRGPHPALSLSLSSLREVNHMCVHRELAYKWCRLARTQCQLMCKKGETDTGWCVFHKPWPVYLQKSKV